jgi:hypothetical protein
MKDYEISTPDDLNAALVKQSLDKHDKHRKLWRATQVDRSLSTIPLILFAGILLVFGIFAGEESDFDPLFFVGLGVFMLLQFQIYFVQSQNKAVADLLKRIEQRVTQLERRSHSD